MSEVLGFITQLLNKVLNNPDLLKKSDPQTPLDGQLSVETGSVGSLVRSNTTTSNKTRKSKKNSRQSADFHPENEQPSSSELVPFRLSQRLPQGILAIAEEKWDFDLDQVIFEKEITNPGKFSVIRKGSYLGRTVCIKEVNINEEDYALTEISLLRSLSHENILPLIGAARKYIDEIPCLIAVTEFMEGGSLGDLIRVVAKKDKDEAFPWPARINAALQAAKAVEYLHNKGVIHRDIKLDNLLISDHGSQFTLKLADFGFARGLFGPHELQGDERKADPSIFARTPSHNRAQTICGTDETMAPEMILQIGTYTTAVDVFSFGCVLIELCCSKTLDTKDFLERKPETHFGFDDVQVRSKAVKSCPDSLVELALNCTQYEPNDRLLPMEMVEWLEELFVEVQAIKNIKKNGCCVIT